MKKFALTNLNLENKGIWQFLINSVIPYVTPSIVYVGYDLCILFMQCCDYVSNGTVDFLSCILFNVW